MSDSSFGGMIFTCKICGKTHLIPYDCKPDQDSKSIEVPCLYQPNEYRKYQGYEFSTWVGHKMDYLCNRVKPCGFNSLYKD